MIHPSGHVRCNHGVHEWSRPEEVDVGIDIQEGTISMIVFKCITCGSMVLTTTPEEGYILYYNSYHEIPMPRDEFIFI